jgi:hypothetical protein
MLLWPHPLPGFDQAKQRGSVNSAIIAFDHAQLRVSETGECWRRTRRVALTIVRMVASRLIELDAVGGVQGPNLGCPSPTLAPEKLAQCAR